HVVGLALVLWNRVVDLVHRIHNNHVHPIDPHREGDAVEQSLQVETVIARAAKEPEGCRYFLIDLLHVAFLPRALRSANEIAAEVPLHSRFDTLLKAGNEGPPTVKPPEISRKLTQQDSFTRSVRAYKGHERRAHEAEAM